MTHAQVVAIVAKAKEKSDQGVDYTPMCGATCPECGRKRMKVVTSKPWQDGIKIRYHRCSNVSGGCLLAMMQISIKSIQDDK